MYYLTLGSVLLESDRYLELSNSNFNIERTTFRYKWLCCMHSYLSKTINAMYIQQMTEEIPSVQNIVGFCKQITILIFYRVSSRLVTPFKF